MEFQFKILCVNNKLQYNKFNDYRSINLKIHKNIQKIKICLILLIEYNFHL